MNALDIIAYDTETGAPVTYREAVEFTRELLDEVYPPLTIGELTYDASRCLELVDPIAFREVVLEEIDYRIKDGSWSEEPVAYVGLWYGGTGYHAGSWATDAEIFDSLDHAHEVFEARADNLGHLALATHAVEWDENDGTARKGAELDPMLTPRVDDAAHIVLARLSGATLDGLENDHFYAADYVIHAENGTTRLDEPIVYAL